MKIYIIPSTPDYWKPEYPSYNSPEGWEFEKALVLEQIKKSLAS